MPSHRYQSVDEYIASYPKQIADRLTAIRQLIKSTVPDSTEYIGYNMPAYKFHGRLVYFAAFAHHIGIYPMADTIANFEPKLRDYHHAKGSVQLPHDQPLPLDLIARMLEYRALANLQNNSHN